MATLVKHLIKAAFTVAPRKLCLHLTQESHGIDYVTDEIGKLTDVNTKYHLLSLLTAMSSFYIIYCIYS